MIEGLIGLVLGWTIAMVSVWIEHVMSERRKDDEMRRKAERIRGGLYP